MRYHIEVLTEDGTWKRVGSVSLYGHAEACLEIVRTYRGRCRLMMQREGQDEILIFG